MSGYALPTSYWEERGESVIKPIGPLARAIDRMSFQDFAWLMIGLAKKETIEYALKEASFTRRIYEQKAKAESRGRERRDRAVEHRQS